MYFPDHSALREPAGYQLLIRHFVQKYAKEFQRRIILDKAALIPASSHLAETCANWKIPSFA
jgi:hypothetical protein